MGIFFVGIEGAVSIAGGPCADEFRSRGTGGGITITTGVRSRSADSIALGANELRPGVALIEVGVHVDPPLGEIRIRQLGKANQVAGLTMHAWLEGEGAS